MHVMSDQETASALFDEVAQLRREVARWGGLTEAIQQITGEPDGWPSHGNAPLAIAAKMQLMQMDVSRLREALTWYGEQARLCRLIHSEGDAGRRALDADGGKRAREALRLADCPDCFGSGLRDIDGPSEDKCPACDGAGA